MQTSFKAHCGVALLLLAACQGAVQGQVGDSGKPLGPSVAGSGGNASGGSGVGGGSSAGTDALQFSAGLRRLTRIEYANTVRSLFGVEVQRALQPKETIIDGHSQIGAAQKTGYDDTNAYYELADAVAEASTPALLVTLACSDAQCLKVWAKPFLTKLFRAPPNASTEQRYLAIFDEPAAGADAASRLKTFIASALSSPYFLYKSEVGQAAAPAQLDDYEVATRLSYLAWQDTPDDALLQAARGGQLQDPSARSAELTRLLSDPRAQQGLVGFASDWMGLFEDALSKKDAKLLAATSPDFPAAAQRSFELTIAALLGAPSARFTDAFRADHFFADDALAKILGLPAGPAQLEPVAFATQERLGILTHPLIIGAHSKEGGPSPFPMGKFVYQNVLCKQIPPPLPGIPSVSDDSSAQTLRQRLEGLTKDQPCITCHSQIGPPGFAFLPFDPIGRYSQNDALGRPYDTRGALLLPSVAEPVPFQNVSELSQVLAEQPDVARCIGKRLFRFGFGRFKATADASALETLESEAVADGTQVAALMNALVRSPGFSQVRVRP